MLPITDEIQSCFKYLGKCKGSGSSGNRFAAWMLFIEIFLFSISILFALLSKSLGQPNISYVAMVFYILGAISGLGYLIAMIIEGGSMIKKSISRAGLLAELKENESIVEYLTVTFQQETLQRTLIFLQRKLIKLAARRTSMLQLLTIIGGAWFLNKEKNSLLTPFFSPSIADFANLLTTSLTPFILALASGLMFGMFFSLIYTETYTEYIEHLKQAIGSQKESTKEPFLRRRYWISSGIRCNRY
jgi:hypothetical protein